MRRLPLVIAVLAIAAPLFATEPNPSPRQRELVEKLMAITKIDDNMRMMIDTMYGQIEKQFQSSASAEGDDAGSAAEAQEMFAIFRKKAVKIDFGGQLHEAFVRMYSKYFTEQELADLIAFQSSPTGQKALAVMPQLMQEAMQAGTEHLGPQLERVMREAMDEWEQKRPWRKTMENIRGVASALEAYSIDHDELYPSGDYASLKNVLSPAYIKDFPEKDMWGTGYAYVVSGDRKHYRIISAGSDSNFEWDSRRIVLTKDGEEQPVVYRDRLEDDLIYADGSFVQLPMQAKPRAKKN